MPPLWQPTFLCTLLLLSYGRACWTYLADRRRGMSSRAAVIRAAGTGAAAARAVLPFLVGIMFFNGLRVLTPFASPDHLADPRLIAADRFILGNDVGLLVERIG